MDKNQLNLESLFDLSAKLNSSEDKRFILNSALLSIMGKLGITRAAVFLKDNDEFKLIIKKGDIKTVIIDSCDSSGFATIDKEKHPELLNDGFSYSICLSYRDNPSAILLIGKKLNGNEISQFEEQYCKLVSTIASLALQNAEHFGELVNQKLKAEKKSQLLETLFQISRDYSLLLTRDKIIQMTSYSLMGQLMINKFAIVIKSENGSPDLIYNRFDSKFSFDILKSLLDLNEIEFSDDYSRNYLNQNDKDYLSNKNVKIISPMSIHGKVKGFFLIGPKLNSEELNEDDIQFIEALGNTTIVALENERLVSEEIKKKQLENEMNLALEIQRGLFPNSPPKLNNYDIYGLSIPSKQVGGDYYDHIRIDDNQIFLLIADVSGKGIPAAMIMANIQSTLRLLVPMKMELEEILLKINKIVYENTSSDKFVTFFGGILNLKNNSFEYINAGHNPPYLFRDNKFIELREGGLILGLMDSGISYEKGNINIQENDSLILFTDGITEALNEKNEEYGESRLKEFITENHAKDSETFSNELVDEIKKFSFGSGQYDDITLINLKRN